MCVSIESSLVTNNVVIMLIIKIYNQKTGFPDPWCKSVARPSRRGLEKMASFGSWHDRKRFVLTNPALMQSTTLIHWSVNVHNKVMINVAKVKTDKKCSFLAILGTPQKPAPGGPKGRFLADFGVLPKFWTGSISEKKCQKPRFWVLERGGVLFF